MTLFTSTFSPLSLATLDPVVAADTVCAPSATRARARHRARDVVST
jgi:hypothetical protein